MTVRGLWRSGITSVITVRSFLVGWLYLSSTLPHTRSVYIHNCASNLVPLGLKPCLLHSLRIFLEFQLSELPSFDITFIAAYFHGEGSINGAPLLLLDHGDEYSS